MTVPYRILDLNMLRPGRMVPLFVGGGVETPRSQVGDPGAMPFGPGGLLSLKYLDFMISGVQEWRTILYINQLAAMLNTRVNAINVPVMTDLIAPTILPRGSLKLLSTHSDGSTFSDKSKYSQSSIQGDIYGSFTMWANPIRIRIIEGRTLYGGEWFSINHPVRGNRTYRISWIEEKIVVDGKTVYTVALECPLKEAVPDGTRTKFARPLCRMRLAPGFAINAEVSGSVWMANPTFEFLEG